MFYCVCVTPVIARQYIAPQCSTRLASASLFLFGQMPESSDTSKESSSTRDTLGHVPSGIAHRMSLDCTSGNCPKVLIPVKRVALRV